MLSPSRADTVERMPVRTEIDRQTLTHTLSFLCGCAVPEPEPWSERGQEPCHRQLRAVRVALVPGVAKPRQTICRRGHWHHGGWISLCCPCTAAHPDAKDPPGRERQDQVASLLLPHWLAPSFLLSSSQHTPTQSLTHPHTHPRCFWSSIANCPHWCAAAARRCALLCCFSFEPITDGQALC